MKLKIDLSCRNQFGVARSESLPLAVAGMINHTVDEDAEKPGSDLSRFIVRRKRLIGFEAGILDKILSQHRIARHPPSCTKQRIELWSCQHLEPSSLAPVVHSPSSPAVLADRRSPILKLRRRRGQILR